jgi:hypothetical protein
MSHYAQRSVRMQEQSLQRNSSQSAVMALQLYSFVTAAQLPF